MNKIRGLTLLLTVYWNKKVRNDGRKLLNRLKSLPVFRRLERYNWVRDVCLETCGSHAVFHLQIAMLIYIPGAALRKAEHVHRYHAPYVAQYINYRQSCQRIAPMPRKPLQIQIERHWD